MSKTVEDMRKWALTRARHFLELAEKAKDGLDIEANLYGAKQVLAKSFDDFHLLNEFGEDFMVQLAKERKEVNHEKANGVYREPIVPFSPR